MGVKGFPTLKTVRVTSKPGKPTILDYNGARSATEIVEAVKALIPNNVKRIDDKGLKEWLDKDNSTAKAILFSDKGTTSALIKAIANEYLGNVHFAQIRNKETDANKLFGIEKYPTLVVLPGGDKEAVAYDGELKKASMNDFLNKYAEPRKPSTREEDATKPKKASKESDQAKASKASSKLAEASASQASEQASEAAASATTITLGEPDATASPDPIVDEEGPKPVPVPNVPAISELATPEELQSKCLGPKTHTCILALLPPGAEPEAELSEESRSALTSLGQLEQKHKARGSHLFPFYSVAATNKGAETLGAALGLDGSSLHLIAVNGKKNWWREYDSTKGFGDVAVEDWVDGIRFGEGKKQKLPEGIVVSPAVAEEQSTAKGGEDTAKQEDSKQKIIHEDL